MIETHCYVQEDDELGSVKQLLLKKAYMTCVNVQFKLFCLLR